MPSPSADLKVVRIASLTIVNAMIFQQVLAVQDRRIEPLFRAMDKINVAEALQKTWTEILKIDYVPIFTTAREIVPSLLACQMQTKH